MTPLSIAGAVVAAGLAVVVAFELRPQTTAPADPIARPSAAIIPAPLPAALDLSAAARANLVETALARPLFSHTRRAPDADPRSAIGSPSASLPRMTAILIDGPRRTAIFAGIDGGKSTVLAEGSRVGRFTIQTIEPQQVILVGPDGTRTLRTSFDPTLQPPVPLLPAPAAPQFPGIVLPGGAGPGLPGGIPGRASFIPPAVPPIGAGYAQPSGAAR